MKRRRQYELNIETLTIKALRAVVYTSVAVTLGLVCIYMTTVSARLWYLPLLSGAGLVASYVGKLFWQENPRRILLLFGGDWALILLLSFFLEQPMIVVMILCVLCALYVSITRLLVKSAATMLFFLTYVLMSTDVFRNFNRVVVSDLISTLFVFWFTFFLFNMCMVYLEKLRVEKENAKAIREREENLRKAYRELENVTILRERNRIAKDIHDNVGHAITTVIMQTEAAKLSFDTDRQNAKRSIIAANLQAVSALEQMRSSVHLLSETSTVFDLASEMEKVVAKTTVGTNIAVRAQIDEGVSALPYPLAVLFHSALKEGLSNGIRHGKATAFLFRMRMNKDGKVDFLLSDNGVGAEDFTAGYGLSSLVEQLQAHGYAASFFSEGGDGFEIHIYPENSEEGEEEQ